MLTKKGSATRQRIIEAAATEIRERGVGNVTLDDVGRRSNTGKSQLFHYFPEGREQLLLAVAQREADRVIEDQEPYLSGLTSWDAWRQWRDAVVERYRRQGVNCPLGALTTEINRRTPAAREVTRQLFEQWRHRVEIGIREMQGLGHIDPALDASAAASAVIAAIQGGVVILMTTGSSQHLEAALDFCLDHLAWFRAA